MQFNQPPSVAIDLSRVRANAESVRAKTGVPLIAVIKANAYGLGARRVVETLHDVVNGFYCFTLREAIDAGVKQFGKPTICLVGHENESAADYREQNVRPAVWDIDRATKLRDAQPVLCVDTGMQRFACPRENINAVIEAGAIDEAFTHATNLHQVQDFKSWCVGRGLRLHAAGSSLLDQVEAYLDAVRPGLALYRGAVRVTSRLIEVHDTNGPAGYGGFESPTGRHGVIIGGYSSGLKPGPCFINGQPRRILECGMQSSFVEIGRADRTGEPVELLGDSILLDAVAAAWKASPQEVLLRLASS